MRVLIKEEVLEISEEEEKNSKHGQDENKILLKHSPSKECKIQELSKQIDDIPEVETKSNCEMKIEIEDGCPLLKEDKSQVSLLETSNSQHFLEEISRIDCESDRKLSTLESRIYFHTHSEMKHPTTFNGLDQQVNDDKCQKFNETINSRDKIYHEELSVTSEIFGKSSDQRESLKRLMPTEDRLGLTQHQEYNKSVSEKNYMDADMTTDTNNQFQCEICKKHFNWKHGLKAHIDTHADNRPFECEICRKYFFHRSQLNKHMVIHSGNRQFQCEICNKYFTWKRNLQEHMQTHMDYHPFKCEICSKYFSKKSNLKTHMSAHSRKREFKCEICNKHFTGKHSLKDHLHIHAGDRPFVCEICSKSFIHRYNLKRHMVTHSANRQFQCEMCNKYYTWKRNLKQHIIQNHMHSRPFQC